MTLGYLVSRLLWWLVRPHAQPWTVARFAAPPVLQEWTRSEGRQGYVD